MYKVTWDKDVNGVRLHSRIVEGVLGTSPRPVFYDYIEPEFKIRMPEVRVI